MIAGLGARVHLFVRPEYRDRFHHVFRGVLACDVRELDFGMEYPITLVSFSDGSSFSIEFNDAANLEPDAAKLDYTTALRGAWIEFRTADVATVQQKLRDAGVPSFSHPASPHVYFSAPGGQVFRILDINYKGP